jgi:hypothetical protein
VVHHEQLRSRNLAAGTGAAPLGARVGPGATVPAGGVVLFALIRPSSGEEAHQSDRLGDAQQQPTSV